jgi:hypothetical protein
VTTPPTGCHRRRRHSPAHLPALQPPSLPGTAAALRHVTGSPGPGLLRRLRPVPARSAGRWAQPTHRTGCTAEGRTETVPALTRRSLDERGARPCPRGLHGHPPALHRGLPGRRRKTHQKVPRPKEDAKTHRTRPRSARFEPTASIPLGVTEREYLLDDRRVVSRRMPITRGRLVACSTGLRGAEQRVLAGFASPGGAGRGVSLP